MPISRGRKRKKKVFPSLKIKKGRKKVRNKKYKKIFPTLYSESAFPTSPIWNREFDIDHNSSISYFAHLINWEFKEATKGRKIEDLNVFIHKIFSEFWLVRSLFTNEKDQKKIDFLNLCWGACSVWHINYTNQFHYSYDIFHKSLYYEVIPDLEEPKISPEKIYCSPSRIGI